jgi:hypothetical protein
MKSDLTNTRSFACVFTQSREKKAINRLSAQAANCVLRIRSVCDSIRDCVEMRWRLLFHRSRTGVSPQKVKCKEFRCVARPGWTVSGLGTSIAFTSEDC